MGIKGRLITGNIMRDRFMRLLSYEARLLWIGLICMADDQGRLENDAFVIRAEIFPFDNIEIDTIEKELEALEKVGYIMKYSAEDRELIQITKWWKHQDWMNYPQPSKFQPPEGWIDRIRIRTREGIRESGMEAMGGFDPRMRIQKIEVDKQNGGNGNHPSIKVDTRDTVWANDIFVRVTGFPMIPPRQRADAIEVILALRSRFPNEEEQIAYMKRKFELWQNTKGKDGRYYSKNNLGWLLDWCVTDGGEDTAEDDGWEVL